MRIGTPTASASTDATLGHKNHWVKFSDFILTKSKAYGDVSKLFTHRVPIDYYHQLLADKERQSTARFVTIKSEKPATEVISYR
jgi:hypothetical protein